jgi:hypothetical protein
MFRIHGHRQGQVVVAVVVVVVAVISLLHALKLQTGSTYRIDKFRLSSPMKWDIIIIILQLTKTVRRDTTHLFLRSYQSSAFLAMVNQFNPPVFVLEKKEMYEMK